MIFKIPSKPKYSILSLFPLCIFLFSSEAWGPHLHKCHILILEKYFASAMFFKLVHSDIIVLKKKRRQYSSWPEMCMIKSVKTCYVTVCTIFFPLLMEEFVYDVNKTLTLQLVQLEISNRNYKAIRLFKI